MDPQKLKAGRELDALIAEKVMGLKLGTPRGSKILHVQGESPSFTGKRDVTHTPIPHYSTDIALSWQVIRRLYEITIEGQWDWFCDMQNAADIWRKTDSEAATIICQSALAVIEAKTTIEANTQ